MSVFRDEVTTLVKESKSNSLDQERYLESPTSDERHEAVKEVLLLAEKSAPESLTQDIAELTKHYDIPTVRKLVRSMVRESKTDPLDQEICLKILKKAIIRIDTGQMEQQNLKQLNPLSFKSNWISKKDVERWPLLENLNFDFPTVDERLKIIKEIVLEHNKSASEFFIQELVELTEDFEMSAFIDAVTAMLKAFKISSPGQDRCLERPTSAERREMVKGILLLTKKYAPESLIENIVELTEYYDIRTVKKLVSSMAEESKTNSLDQNNCIATLRKAIDLFAKDEVKEFKLAQIELIISRESLTKIGEEQK